MKAATPISFLSVIYNLYNTGSQLFGADFCSCEFFSFFFLFFCPFKREMEFCFFKKKILPSNPKVLKCTIFSQ